MAQYPSTEAPGLAYQGSIAPAATSATITPAANATLQKLDISITGDAAQTTAGEVSLTVALDGVTIAVKHVYVPAAALGTGVIYESMMDYSGSQFSAGASATLTVTLGNALTAGTVSINALFAA